jgi:hypothetical protein
VKFQEPECLSASKQKEKRLMFGKVMSKGTTVLITVMVVLVGLFGPYGARVAASSSADASADLARGSEAEAARWAALGAHYAARGAEADAARWVAMAQRYAGTGAEADAIRWAALGSYYAGLAEAGRARGAEADAARWVAMGQFYMFVSSK